MHTKCFFYRAEFETLTKNEKNLHVQRLEHEVKAIA